MKMDDLIYLIILIAWVAFAFYRQSQKKKAAQQSQSSPPPSQREGSPFKTLEEILFEEEPEKEVKAPEPEKYERRFQRTATYEPISLEQLYMKDEIESLETLVPAGQEEKVKKGVKSEVPGTRKKEGSRHPLLADFDLRKAVIFAEILHRPYD
jgi:hypothetical protein